MALRVPHRPAVPVALAALAGAALGPLLPAPPLVGLALGAPLGLAAAWREARRRPGRPRWRGPAGRALAACALAGVAGVAGLGARAAARERAAHDPACPPGGGAVVDVEGVLAGPPRSPFPGVVTLPLDVQVGGAAVRILVEAPPRAVGGRPLPGARLAARGRFTPARGPAAATLARQGAAWRLVAGRVVERAPGRGPTALLGAVARAGDAALAAAGLAPERAAFLRAVVLGDRADLPRERAAALRATGTAHLLSISGLHVTLLAGVALALARAVGLGTLARAAAVVAAVAVYVGVAGPAVPVLRAAAAGVVAFSLPWRGDAWNRLAVGLAAALAWDPLCPWQAGTVLSFGTVALLLLVEPWLRRALGAAWPVDPLRDLGRLPLGRAPRRHAPRGRGPAAALGRAAAGALAAFLASAPLIAWTLGDLPLVSLAANPPTIALFSFALGLGALGVATGAVAPALGAPLLRLAEAPVAAIFAVVEVAARVPGGRTQVPPAPPALAVLAAGLLAWGAARRERRPGCRRGRAALLAGAALGAALLARRPGAAAPALVVDGEGRRAVVAAGGEALGLGPAPGAAARAALACAAGARGAGTAWVGSRGTLAAPDAARAAGLLPVPLVDGALVRVDLSPAAGPGRRVLVVVDAAALARGRGARRLAALAADALRADALVVLGRAPPAHVVAALVARSGAARAVADVPPAAAAPARLAAPDAAGRVALAGDEAGAGDEAAADDEAAAGGEGPGPPR